MLLLLIFFIIAICIVLFYYIQTKKFQKKIIEQFYEDETYNLTEEDKQLYFSIIDTYQMLLERDPSEDEINLDFNDIKTNKIDTTNLYTRLLNSSEYKRLNDIQDNSAFAPANAKNDIQDFTEVSMLLDSIMPENKEKDPIHLEFLLMKYRSMNKDKDKFTTYIKDTPEYKEYTEIYAIKDDKKTKETKTPTNEQKDVVSLIDNSKNVEFTISRPDVGKSTLETKSIPKNTSPVKNIMNKLKNEMNIEDENTCSFYQKFAEYNKDQKLSKLVNKRALEQLKYHCDLTKEYENLDKNMLLLNDQKWSVPQKHTPVCHSQECAVQDMLDQTSLIGTLLEETTNNQIMPKFEYSEKV
jgi:hypothetical protein